MDEEDLKGWRVKPYAPPDEEAEWVNPEWPSHLLLAGQTGHIPFLNQEHQERTQSEKVTNPSVNTSNDQHIAIADQNSTKLARAQQPVVDEGHWMQFGGLSKVPMLSTFSKMDAANEKWVFNVESAGKTHGEALLKEGIRRSLSGEAAKWYIQAQKKATVMEIIKHMDRVHDVVDPIYNLMTNYMI